jgi:hypothetical protein
MDCYIGKEIKYSFIQFKCVYPLKNSEQLYVVGNIPELGMWDVKKAEKLNSSANIDLKISNNLKVIQNKEIEYRYIIYENSDFKHWEEGLREFENRKVNPKDYYMIIVNDKKGKN